MPEDEVEEDELEETIVTEEDSQEDEIEETKGAELNLQDLEFHQFMQPEEGPTPTLEKVTGGHVRPIFVGGIPQGASTISGEEKESDPFKYVAGQDATDEPKYVESERISAPVERVDFSRARREQPGMLPQTNQQAFMNQFSEQRNFTSQNVESFEGSERINIRERGRKDPFEKEDRKYKADLPKG